MKPHDLRANVLDYTTQIPDGLLPRDMDTTEHEEFHVYIARLISESIQSMDNTQPQHFMLSGEPSSGKTTELKRIASSLLEDESIADTLLPVYSELQYAIAGDVSDNTFWKNLVSGSADPELASLVQSESLQEFQALAKSENKKFVLFLDTLDILLLDNHEGMAKKWSEFLASATEQSIPVIWTCRPFEWKFFSKEFPEEMNSITHKIDLPSLSHHALNSFPLPEKFEQESHEDFTNCWNHWSVQFQSKMPLFAQRFRLPESNHRHLHSSFIERLIKEFESMFNSNLEHSNPLDLLKKQLPTGLYYAWIWDIITETMNDHFQINSEKLTAFKHQFEDWLSSIVVQQTSTSEVPKIRLRFYVDDVFELISNDDELTLTAEELVDVLNVSESFGLVEKYGTWFEFSHQLLFEEALYSSSSRNNNDFHTHFPSIQIRSLRGDVHATEGEIDENYDSIIHWTGGFYAYHPTARLESSNLRSAWAPWLAHANKYLQNMELFYDTPMDEFGEKGRILRGFLKDSKQQALFLNGAPGTGKTYFCYHFLEYHLLQQTKPLKWRYVTLSEPLVDHFHSGWLKYQKLDQVDQRLKRRAEKSEGRTNYFQQISVLDLLQPFDPSLHKLSMFRDSREGGLLNFQKFKELFENFCTSNRQPFKRPGVADAWHDYLECWHDPVTGERKKSKHGDFKRMKLKGKDLKVFTTFVNEHLKGWKTYNQACFEASTKFLDMPVKQQELLQHDLLMVDEIQDMTPPILTFLLLLSAENIDHKKILLTGDQLQTVNRSGFNWQRMTQTSSEALTKQSLKISQRFENCLISAIDIYSQPWEINTLRTPWRSAPSITTFNDHMRQGFGLRHGIKLQDYLVDSVPNLSDEASNRENHAQVTLVLCEENTDFEECIALLKDIEIEVGEYGNTALLTPYDHEVKQLANFGSFTMYNGETVKGLEFDNVIVAQPYELLYSEALSSLGLDPVNSAEMSDRRLVSWVKSNSNEAKVNLAKFVNDLYDNIRTRMNVMFSRAKFKMVVLLRQPLGKGWILDDTDPTSPTLVIDYPHPSPEFESDQIKLVSINNPTKEELLDALLLPEGVGDVTLASRFRRAIESEKMRDGESYQNIRNLWRSYVKMTSSNAASANPIRSAALLGGYINNKHSRKITSLQPILHALRPGTLDEEQVASYGMNFSRDYDYLSEKFLISLYGNCSQVDDLIQCPVLEYAELCSNLDKLMHAVLEESASERIRTKHPQLLGILLEQVFGIHDVQVTVDILNNEKYTEPMDGLRILFDQELIKDNGGSVIQLKPISLLQIESMVGDEDIMAFKKNSRSEMKVSWKDSPRNLSGTHGYILNQLYQRIKNPFSRQIIEHSRLQMENNDLPFMLSGEPDSSSFWTIVDEEMPLDDSIVSLLFRSILWHKVEISPHESFELIVGPYQNGMTDSVFDVLLSSWFENSRKARYDDLLEHAGLVFDLHSYLNQPPNLTICELLVLVAYGEENARNWYDSSYSISIPEFKTNSEKSSSPISVIEHWSDEIAACFGFTGSALNIENHEINQDTFSRAGFEQELLLFIPKMKYLHVRKDIYRNVITSTYLKKFFRSCQLHWLGMMNELTQKIVSILQHFILPPERKHANPEQLQHRSHSKDKFYTIFESTFDEKNYGSIVASYLLPLLSITESRFVNKYVRDDGFTPAEGSEMDSFGIAYSTIVTPELDGWFSRAYTKLLKLLNGKEAATMLSNYNQLVKSMTAIHWPINGGTLGRDLVKREHIFYWGKMIEIFDMNPHLFTLKIRKRFRPHYLLPLGRTDEPDDRAIAVKDSIEAIRRGLRKPKNRTELRIWLSRAFAYLAPPQNFDKIHNWRENPTRALAVQCLEQRFYNADHEPCPHYLDWSVFLMLSTISHEQRRQQVDRDVEITIHSIQEEITGNYKSKNLISSIPPKLSVDEARPLIDNFDSMLDDPYTELTERFTQDAVDVGLATSGSYEPFIHPVIVPGIQLEVNSAQRLYLLQMKSAFYDYFSAQNEDA